MGLNQQNVTFCVLTQQDGSAVLVMIHSLGLCLCCSRFWCRCYLQSVQTAVTPEVTSLSWYHAHDNIKQLQKKVAELCVMNKKACSENRGRSNVIF